MLDINSFKCTSMLVMLFVLLAVGAVTVGVSRAASSPWQMSGLIGFVFGFVGVNLIKALIAGAIAWLCGRKKIPFPAMCNVAISALLIFQLIAGLAELAIGPHVPFR